MVSSGKKHRGVLHSSVHRAQHRKHKLRWSVILLCFLIFLVAVATGNYFFDFRGMAAGAACQSMNKNQCNKNSSYCQWTAKPAKYKESKETCGYNDCVRATSGCRWETKQNGKKVCDGKKTIKKEIPDSDGQCALRPGVRVLTRCKEKDVKGKTICKRGVWVPIQCNRLGSSFCQKSGRYDEFIQCGEYGQILTDTRCEVGKEECRPGRGCIPLERDAP